MFLTNCKKNFAFPAGFFSGMAILETMKGVSIGKSTGNSFGNLKLCCSRLIDFGPEMDVFRQRGGWEVPPQTNRGVFWPNHAGAFEVVLAGSRLGKPGVFNQKRFIYHVLTLPILQSSARQDNGE